MTDAHSVPVLVQKDLCMSHDSQPWLSSCDGTFMILLLDSVGVSCIVSLAEPAQHCFTLTIRMVNTGNGLKSMCSYCSRPLNEC